MRRLFTLLPCFFLIAVMQAQTLQPAVIASNGGVSQSDKLTLEWTLGEPFVEGITGEERSYTEGFHQPVIRIGNVESTDTEATTVVDKEHGITVYPNPVSTGLTIDLSSHVSNEMQWQLITQEGKSVMAQAVDPAFRKTEVDMSSLVPGTYILWFSNLKGEKITAFTISKIQ